MSENDTSNQDKLLDTKFKIYTYTTNDYEPGTIIAPPNLDQAFADDNLFRMNELKTRVITLRELLEKGFISIGSTDSMETVDITYPTPGYSDSKPVIKGTYMHGSRKIMIGQKTGVEFEYEPDSAEEFEGSDDEEPVKAFDGMDWLADVKYVPKKKGDTADKDGASCESNDQSNESNVQASSEN